MEIPLCLSRRTDGGVVYGIPLWYRIMTAIMLGLVGGGLFSSGEAPGLTGYIVIALLVLGLVYEESWSLEPKEGRLRKKEGFFPFSRTRTIGFDEISALRLSALAKGTVPGSAEEKLESERAFAMLRGGSGVAEASRAAEKHSIFKPRKKYSINLIVRTKSGEDILVDSVPVSSAKRLVELGKAISSACGVELMES